MSAFIRVTKLLSGGRKRRFVLAGGIGFVTDAILLTLLTRYAGWSPLHARLLSFLGAVSVTWLINRYYAFADRRAKHGLATAKEYWRYVITQSAGASINFAVFAMMLWLMPGLSAYPVVPLAVASVCALIINYYFMKNLVFTPLHEPG
ncbi:MAG: GtrA family protein [Steroidobacteraceae bacterium]